MRHAIVLLGLIPLAACATQKTVYLPDGRKGYSINCSGAALSWEMCYQKAGAICTTNGYEIVAKDGDQGATMSGTQYGIFAGSVITRVLLIACK